MGKALGRRLQEMAAWAPHKHAVYLGEDGHRRLYADLPQVQCPPDCHECCGHVWWSEWELSRLTDEERDLLAGMGDEDESCCFVTAEGCAVYDRRPFACRVYGAVADLPCGDGAPCEGEPLGLREAKRRRVAYCRQCLTRSGEVPHG